MAIGNSIAVLLKNSQNKQVLPVSKANLIELLGSTYTNYFTGKIDKADVDSALAYISGTHIPAAIAEAKAYTTTSIESLTYNTAGTAGKAVTAVTETNGVIAPVQGNVYSEFVQYDSEDATTLKSYLDALTAKDAEIITAYETAYTTLDNRIDALEEGQAIKLTKGSDSTASTGAATGNDMHISNDGVVYKLWQGTEQIAQFEFNEKDSFVESGAARQATVADVTAATPDGGTAPFAEGDWIIALTLKVQTNQGDTSTKTVYIPAESLVDAYTSGSQAGDMVVVGVDNSTNKITATITDGTVTKSKLSQGVQDSLDLADSAVQDVTLNGTSIVSSYTAALTILTGSTDGTISVNNSDVAVKGLLNIAYTGLASDAKVTRAANSELSYLTDPADTTDTNVQAALEILAGKVNVITGGMVTSIDGDTYTNNGVTITLDTNNTTGDVTVSVSESNLDNVATLHYDELNVTTEDFSIYSVVSNNP